VRGIATGAVWGKRALTSGAYVGVPWSTRTVRGSLGAVEASRGGFRAGVRISCISGLA
jgi:hypothetical protein